MFQPKRQIFAFRLCDKNESAAEFNPFNWIKHRAFFNVVLILCKHTPIFYLSNSFSCDRLHRSGPIDTGWPQKKVKKSHTNVSASAYSNLTCINFQWWYLCGIIPYDSLSSGTTEKQNSTRSMSALQCTRRNGYMRFQSAAPCAQKQIERNIERISKNCVQSSPNAKRFMAISLWIEAIVQHSKHGND